MKEFPELRFFELVLKTQLQVENIYTSEIRGLGGYPTGIQGKGLLMLSGGIDSPVAGFLANKRGIDIDCEAVVKGDAKSASVAAASGQTGSANSAT